MFIQLFRLCRRDTPLGKTPLEDFTTEALVGILQLNETIRCSFIDWLGLPSDNYYVSSQKNYAADRCIIDIVIEGERNLCFIESKVESKENPNQLPKYSKLLSRLHKEEKKTTYLKYLTKKHDPKNFKEHNFQNIRWYEVYQELSKYDDPLVNDFLKFLKIKKMSKKTTLNIEDFQVMSNMKDTMETIKLYLDTSKEKFKALFGEKLSINEIQFGSHNRWIHSIKKIVDDKKYSDFTFGFYFDEPQMYVGLYVEKENTTYQKIKNISEKIKNKGFYLEIRKTDDGGIHGLIVSKSKPISYLLNDENAPNEIKDWFETTFIEFDQFFRETDSELNWKF